MNNNKTHLIGAQNLVGLALCRPGGHLFGRDVGGDGAFGPLLVVVQNRDLRVLVGTRQDHLSLDLMRLKLKLILIGYFFEWKGFARNSTSWIIL
jgi:hypothetical protein